MPTGYQIYNQSACYFLTLQIVDWIDIFTRQVYRDIVVDCLNFCRRIKGLEIFAYVVMSNHVHLVLRSPAGKLSDTVRDLKSYTAKEILKAIDVENESRRYWLRTMFGMAAARHKRNAENQVWTHENHAVELNSSFLMDQKIEYIHQNPVRAGIVAKPEDYVYSSAAYFAGCNDLVVCVIP